MCLVNQRPREWPGLWAALVAFDIFTITLTIYNAAEQPRRVGDKLIADLMRDGGIFFFVSKRMLSQVRYE